MPFDHLGEVEVALVVTGGRVDLGVGALARDARVVASTADDSDGTAGRRDLKQGRREVRAST